MCHTDVAATEEKPEFHVFFTSAAKVKGRKCKVGHLLDLKELGLVTVIAFLGIATARGRHVEALVMREAPRGKLPQETQREWRSVSISTMKFRTGKLSKGKYIF